MDRLAIEFICVFGMPPVEFIELAAGIGCRKIGMAPAPIVTLDGLYDPWNLLSDAALRRDTLQALKDNDVSVSLAEGFLIMPGMDVAALAPALDLAVELGAPIANACCLHPDLGGNVQGFGQFAEMAGERGLKATVEFLAGMPLGTLPLATELVRQVGRDNAGMLIDPMHLFRSGSTAADLAATDPARIFYAQICDLPLVSPYADFSEEARFERGAPGEGEFPLADYVRALPQGVVIGLEAPMRARLQQGQDAAQRLVPALEKTRELLAAAGVQ